jgi:hypothetical protein
VISWVFKVCSFTFNWYRYSTATRGGGGGGPEEEVWDREPYEYEMPNRDDDPNFADEPADYAVGKGGKTMEAALGGAELEEIARGVEEGATLVEAALGAAEPQQQTQQQQQQQLMKEDAAMAAEAEEVAAEEKAAVLPALGATESALGSGAVAAKVAAGVAEHHNRYKFMSQASLKANHPKVAKAAERHRDAFKARAVAETRWGCTSCIQLTRRIACKRLVSTLEHL